MRRTVVLCEEQWELIERNNCVNKTLAEGTSFLEKR